MGDLVSLDKTIRRSTGVLSGDGREICIILDPGPRPGAGSIILRPKGSTKAGEDDVRVTIEDLWKSGGQPAADAATAPPAGTQRPATRGDIARDIKSKIMITPGISPAERSHACSAIDAILNNEECNR